MKLFAGSTKPPTIEERPAAEDWATTRKRELRLQINQTDAALTGVNEQIRDFVRDNFVTINGVLSLRASSVEARPQLDAQLLELQKRRDTLLQKWNLILRDWAEVTTTPPTAHQPSNARPKHATANGNGSGPANSGNAA